MSWLVWPKDRPLQSGNYKLKAEFCQGCTPYMQGLWGSEAELNAIIETMKNNENH